MPLLTPRPLPTDPGRRLALAEARAGALADALRAALRATAHLDGHADSCARCRAGKPCSELTLLEDERGLALAQAVATLARQTGVRGGEGDTFTVLHHGEMLTGVCPHCLAVIAGQALRCLPAEPQRVLIASAPEGQRLLRAAGRVAGRAVTGRSIPAAAMDELAGAVARYPAGPRLHEHPLARAVRAGEQR